MENPRAEKNDLIVGRNAVLEALQSGRAVDSVWVARGDRTGSIGKIRRSGLRVINLREGDELISVFHTEGDSTIMLASHCGKAVRFDENEVRVMGRTAAGVRGMDLQGDDYIVGAVSVEGDELLLSVTERGYGKRTPVSEYAVKHRAGMGMICHDVTDKTGPVAAIRVARDDEDLLLAEPLYGEIVSVKQP